MQRQLTGIAFLVIVLLAAGCGSPPTATPPPPTDTPIPPAGPDWKEAVFIKESVGFGEPQIIYTLTIDAEAGAFTLAQKDKDPVEGAVDAETLEALGEAVEEVGFFDFDEDYIPPDGTCCDMVYYTLTVTRGEDQSHSVRASDSTMPDGYQKLIDQMTAVVEGEAGG